MAGISKIFFELFKRVKSAREVAAPLITNRMALFTRFHGMAREAPMLLLVATISVLFGSVWLHALVEPYPFQVVRQRGTYV